MKDFCKFTTESPAASYMPLPRFLFQDEALRDITNDAKVLYAMLLDRASISKQNGYVEPDGTIRLYFTVEQAQKRLHRRRSDCRRGYRRGTEEGIGGTYRQGIGSRCEEVKACTTNIESPREKSRGDSFNRTASRINTDWMLCSPI